MKWFNIVFLFVFALTACTPTPSPGVVQTAIVETQGALPISTLTATILPATSTNTPTSTPTQTATSTPTSTPLPTEITGVKGVTMRLVPAGDFIMGWNGQINAYLDDFYMDKYEVTNALYKTCVDAGACPSPRIASYEAYANYPVVYVNWGQAQAYCAWRGASLPTIAQWEKAARGTDGRTYPWGDDFDGNNLNYCDRNCSAVWQDDNYDDGYAAAAPVGTYESGQSPYGIYDMAGNVWEWVDDWDSDQYRVIRGGSWIDVNYGGKLHSAYGGRLTPNTSDSTVGFRCAMDVKP